MKCGKIDIPERYVFVFMGFFGFVNVYAMRVNLSVAIVAMVNDTIVLSQDKKENLAQCNELIDKDTLNRTRDLKGQKYNWDSSTQGRIMGSFFYGYVITQLPGGTMAEKFGAKFLFGGGILITAILSLMTPWAADVGENLLLTVRIFEGFAEGVAFPTMNHLISRWAPKFERSRISTLIFTGALMGNVVTYPICGWLCATDLFGGWPSAFYVFGTIGCIWFIFWCFLVFETPSAHPRISAEEKFFIESNNGKQDPLKILSVPWKEIFSSIPFWAVIIAEFGHSFGFLMWLTELPHYMGSILHFKIQANGLLSSLPYLIQMLSAWTASYVADRMRKARVIETTNIRKLFTAIGFYGPAFCMVGITQSGCRPMLIFGLITLAMGLNGCIYPGCNCMHVDMSPDFAGTLFGITNTLCNFGGIFGPAMVGFFTKDGNTVTNWNKVFYITIAVYIATATFFIFFASAELQPWGKKPEAVKENLLETPSKYDSIEDNESKGPSKGNKSGGPSKKKRKEVT